MANRSNQWVVALIFSMLLSFPHFACGQTNTPPSTGAPSGPSKPNDGSEAFDDQTTPAPIDETSPQAGNSPADPSPNLPAPQPNPGPPENPAPAPAPQVLGQVQISTVDGQPNSYRDSQLERPPSQVVSFTANGFSADGVLIDLRPQDFIWSWNSTDNLGRKKGEQCDPEYPSACSKNTRFYVNSRGVSLITPPDMDQYLVVSVQSRDGRFQDSITLKNPRYSEYKSAPAVPITSYEDYTVHYKTLDPDLALRTHTGQWVVIGGVRYYQPLVALDWEPYRRGHWTYSDNLGDWVWVSEDPWGWMTDHYGVWRLWNRGDRMIWVWRPFPDLVYRPHCVTFYRTDTHVAWVPYYGGFAAAYEVGYSRYFSDGFSVGFSISSAFGRPGFRFGLTVVETNVFTRYDLWSGGYVSVTTVNTHIAVFRPVIVIGEFRYRRPPDYGYYRNHSVPSFRPRPAPVYAERQFRREMPVRVAERPAARPEARPGTQPVPIRSVPTRPKPDINQPRPVPGTVPPRNGTPPATTTPPRAEPPRPIPSTSTPPRDNGSAPPRTGTPPSTTTPPRAEPPRPIPSTSTPPRDNGSAPPRTGTPPSTTAPPRAEPPRPVPSTTPNRNNGNPPPPRSVPDRAAPSTVPDHRGSPDRRPPPNVRNNAPVPNTSGPPSTGSPRGNAGNDRRPPRPNDRQ